MEVLLDHCVPRPFKCELAEYEVSTAREMGWEALSNGDLLEQARRNGFEVFVTVDQNIRYQQSLKQQSIAVCVLASGGITAEDLAPLVPKLKHVLSRVQAGMIDEIVL